MNPGNPVTSIRTAARECTDVRSAAPGSGSGADVPIPHLVKRLAIITAAAALALTPAAAAAPNSGKTGKPDKPAKSERTKKARPDSARARCAAEKDDLGAAAFAVKYGKARTKGSAKAKAKAARAAMGRCVSRTAKVIRAEREAEAQAADPDELDENEDRDLGDHDEDDDTPEAPEAPEAGDDEDDAHVDLDVADLD